MSLWPAISYIWIYLRCYNDTVHYILIKYRVHAPLITLLVIFVEFDSTNIWCNINLLGSKTTATMAGNRLKEKGCSIGQSDDLVPWQECIVLHVLHYGRMCHGTGHPQRDRRWIFETDEVETAHKSRVHFTLEIKLMYENELLALSENRLFTNLKFWHCIPTSAKFFSFFFPDQH